MGQALLVTRQARVPDRVEADGPYPYLVPVGGKPEPLAHIFSVAIPVPSPDSTQFADYDHELSLAPLTGTGPVEQPVGLPAESIAWSPDGGKLAFTDGPKLHVMNADGTALQTIAGDVAGQAQVSLLSWSPDGAHIAYVAGNPARTHLVVVTVTGAHRRVLSSVPATAAAPSWSPDGRTLVFDNNGAIWAANVNGGRPMLVTREGGCVDEYPSWSPDGRRIAFESFIDTSDGFFDDIKAICVVNADGTGRRQLTEFDARAEPPQWDPESRLIAFVDDASPTLPGGGKTSITLVGASGTRSLELTPGPGYFDTPRWVHSARR